MMLNLIKYEFLRKQKQIIMFFSILVFLELGILFGIYKGGQWAALSIAFIFVMLSSSVLVVFIDTLRSYSVDLNEKQGYSLFLTPTNGYKIIGSKAIVSLIELAFVVLVVFGLMVINFEVTKSLYYDSVSELTSIIIDFVKSQNIIPTIGQTSLLVITSTLEWFSVIMIAILAMTLRKTILSNSKIGWFISFVFFIAIYSGMEILNALALTAFGFIGDMNNIITISSSQTDITIVSDIIYKYFKLACILFPIYISLLFYFSGRLLNKRVDL